MSCRVEWHSSQNYLQTITGCLGGGFETIVIIITGKAAGKKFKISLSDGRFEGGKYFELRQKQKQTVSKPHSSKRSTQCAKEPKEKKKRCLWSEGTANLLHKFCDELECFARPVGSGTHN